MSKLTKRAITECTVELAKRKPLNKITIKDITFACGITRNTFYYYFHDIYDVLDTLIQEKIEELKSKPLDSAVFDLIEDCLSQKKIWINIYRTLGHDKLSGYLMKHIRKLIMEDIKLEAGDRPISEFDTKLISSFYEEAIFGVLIRWLTSTRDFRTNDDIKKAISRIRILFDGQIKLAIENVHNADNK